MIAVVDARAGHARELRAAIEELAAAVRREPGCLTFVPYQDLGKELPDSLRAAGAESQVMVLASRLPGAGEFSLFRRQEGHQDRFRFGREADGSPAKPWSWEDLD